VDGQEEWIVEKILNKRERADGTQYLVKWEGYSEAESTWEPEDGLGNANRAVREYEEPLLDVVEGDNSRGEGRL